MGAPILPPSAPDPEVRGNTRWSSGGTDPTVADVHALGSQEASLFDLMAGHQPTGRGYNAPPVVPAVIPQEPADSTVGTRVAGLGGNFAV